MTQGEENAEDASRQPAPQLAAALSSVKNLVTIVMGLALTHTIVTVLSGEASREGASQSAEFQQLLPLSLIPAQTVLCGVAVITAIVRFYHGNSQLLERLYGEGSDETTTGSRSGGIGGNFIVIMVQSVFFALMSFYVDGSRSLILLFGILLLLDIFWYLANLTTTNTEPTALKQQQRWMINNLGFLAVLTVLYSIDGASWTVTAAAGAILANTLVDFWISWDFYFPGHSESGASAAGR